MRNRLIAAAVACFGLTSGLLVLAKPPAKPAAAGADDSMMMDDSMSMKGGTNNKPSVNFGQDKPLTKQQTDFFENRVRPILVANCYKCHSEEDRKTKGGLVLDTRDGWRKGGEDGQVIVPGNPDKSMLIKAIRYKDEDLQMPPDNNKMRDSDIAVLEQWVKMGAPDPRVPTAVKLSGLNDKARAHWAYQPVKNPPVPIVKNTAWVKNPVDAFVLAKLEQNAMEPSKPATREALIRRATYDLTGMPPTPGEVNAFVTDESSDAFAKVVDRLLASPHFGERWGRYWLDTARYSDTSGADKVQTAYRYPYAWTYRDYVVQSFNSDKPYDQFLKEQLAADQMPQTKDNSRLAALGYLTIGKRFQNPNDTIDERIDAVSKGMLGITVACARCHDHKFDPIPQADYYSLHGVFASTMEPSSLPMIGDPKQNPAYPDFVQKYAEVQERCRERYYTLLQEKGSEFRKNAAAYIMVNTINRRSDADEINLRDKIIADNHLERDIFQGGAKYYRGNVEIFAPMIELWQAGKDGFAEALPRVLNEIAAGGNQRRRLNPIVVRAFASVPPNSIHSLQDVANVYGKIFTLIDSKANDYLKACKNAKSSVVTGYDPAMVAFFNIPAEIEPAPNLTIDHLTEIAPSLPVVNQQGFNRLNLGEMNELLLTHPGSPPRAMVVEDSQHPQNSPIFIRGEALNKGPVVPRQFLAILAGRNRRPFTRGSGRLELAEDIASKDNPLTARVMVNRIWMHLFGQAFVRTPDDLGARCEDPSHPELLDYLSRRFMASNWSVKQTIRLIMLSNTYQQNSETNPTYTVKDPENRLLWRANLRRLDFEAIRDSMLTFSGNLDPTLGGNPVNLTDEPYSYRRSIYGYIDRGNLPELLSQFDFADPDMANSRRTSTIVPQQALFFMNSPMCVDVARKVTSRPEFLDASDSEGRIASIYAILFQRAPRPEEVKAGLEFLEASGGDNLASDSPPQTQAQIRTAKQAQARAERQTLAMQTNLKNQKGRRGLKTPVFNTDGTIVDRRPLTPWEQYAQALLFTNEIAYVN